MGNKVGSVEESEIKEDDQCTYINRECPVFDSDPTILIFHEIISELYHFWNAVTCCIQWC